MPSTPKAHHPTTTTSSSSNHHSKPSPKTPLIKSSSSPSSPFRPSASAACSSQQYACRHRASNPIISPLSAHLKSIALNSDDWILEMTTVLRRVMEHALNDNVFNKPVDDTPIPDYYQVVHQPMDLSTVKAKLEDADYKSPAEFRADVHLVFSNAKLFNGPRHPVEQAAGKLCAVFDEAYEQALSKLAQDKQAADEHVCDACEGQRCLLCQHKCIEFRPPSLRCSCTSKILRNAVYYRWGGERGQHWCNRCYLSLGETFTGLLGQCLRKHELERKVNDDMFLEPWVECSKCRRWMHQICAGFDSGYDKKTFTCPLCYVGANKPARASALPRCSMGDYLATRVTARVLAELSKEPINPGEAVLQPKLSVREARPIADSLTVRIVSASDCAGLLEPRTARWVEAQGAVLGHALPAANPYRAKTIVVFQERDGFDVLVYAVYVQEYSGGAEPNAGNVYLSYLDSVGFIKPRRLRTPVYQEIVAGYLTWVRNRGFARCYIWACPPARGDAYVMYCHPRWQRTPSAERLRRWYAQIVAKLTADGVVVGDKSMLAQHLADVKPLVHTRRSTMSAPAHISTAEDKSLRLPSKPVAPHYKTLFEHIPIFAGDFIQTEIETVLAQLEQDLDGDVTGGLPRMWWRAVWGDGPDVEVTRREKLDADPFTPLGISRPTVTWTIRPSVKLRESVLVRYENELGFSAIDRDQWLLRRVAASVRPIKDNFLVLQLAPLDGGGATHNHRTKRSKSNSDSGSRADPDEALPQTLFDTRLSLLDFMQWSHLQFDQLRRAKHSSLVLIHRLLKTFGGEVAQ